MHVECLSQCLDQWTCSLHDGLVASRQGEGCVSWREPCSVYTLRLPPSGPGLRGARSAYWSGNALCCCAFLALGVTLLSARDASDLFVSLSRYLHFIKT